MPWLMVPAASRLFCPQQHQRREEKHKKTWGKSQEYELKKKHLQLIAPPLCTSLSRFGKKLGKRANLIPTNSHRPDWPEQLSSENSVQKDSSDNPIASCAASVAPQAKTRITVQRALTSVSSTRLMSPPSQRLSGTGGRDGRDRRPDGKLGGRLGGRLGGKLDGRPGGRWGGGRSIQSQNL